MKTRVTKKYVMQFENVIEIPHNSASYLLQAHDPLYYTCGTYGWNADVYSIFHEGETFKVVHGSRSFGHRYVRLESVKPYNDRAHNVWNEIGIPYEERVDRVEEILHEFIEEQCK